MLAQIAAEVLSDVVAVTARWTAFSAVSTARGRTVRREAEIAARFDTYELDTAPLPVPAAGEETAAAWLRGDATQAVLHELLALRMTAGPEEHVERLRAMLLRTAGDVGTGWANDVFDWADEAIRGLVVKLESRDPRAWRAARDDAFGARIVAVLHAIERHAAGPYGDPAADDAWITRYRRQLRRAYGMIEPPDFTRRRTVPVDSVYVPPEASRPGVGGHEVVSFDELVTGIDRLVLLGDPGSGKTTAAQVITHRWAGDPSARVPFLVVLRQFVAGDGPRRSVVAHIEEQLGSFHQCPPPAGTVERLLLDRRAAVIFDGLDELLDTGRRLEVTRTIEQFCEQYPLAPVMVTSRLVGYDEARLDEAQFTRYTIDEFDEHRTRAYAANWFALDDPGSAEWRADTFMVESEQVADLRSNPLMLSLMCILYQGEGTLPRDRPGVYEQCSRLLFDRWDARRKIRYELRARNHIEPALRRLAYWLFTRKAGTEVTEHELVGFTTGYLHERGFEQRVDAEAAAWEFVEFCRGRAWILSDTGTTGRGEALYTFTHRTFLEYFAACHLASICDTPQQLARKLAPHIARAEWDVVAQLAVQIKDRAQDRGAERFFAALIREKRRPYRRANVLAFLARCLEIVEPPPPVVRDLTRAILDHFISGDLDDKVRFEPLAELITRSGPWRAVVAEDIAAAAASAVSAGGAARKRALLWMMNLDDLFVFLRESDLDFWESAYAQLVRRHRAAVVEGAHTDDRLWFPAVLRPPDGRPLLTISEALRLRNRPPLPILEGKLSSGAFGSTWPSLVNYLDTLGHRNPASVQRQVADLAGWLIEHDPPFFATRRSRIEPFPVWADKLDPGNEAAPGAAILVASFAEALEDSWPVGLGGALAGLERYLKREPGDLPDLQLPPYFQDLLRRWARREIDFVEILPDPPSSTGPAR